MMNVKINLCEKDILAIIAEKYNVPVELVVLQCIPDLRDTYRKPEITADIILPEERAIFVDMMMRAKKEPDEPLTGKTVTNPCTVGCVDKADWNCCHTDGTILDATKATVMDYPTAQYTVQG